MFEQDSKISLENFSKKEVHEHLISHDKMLYFLYESLTELHKKVEATEEVSLQKIAISNQLHCCLTDRLESLEQRLVEIAESKLIDAKSLESSIIASSSQIENVALQKVGQIETYTHQLIQELEDKLRKSFSTAIIPVEKQLSTSIVVTIVAKIKSLVLKIICKFK
jgi:hypothetical protein